MSEYWFGLQLVVELASVDELLAHLRYAVQGITWPVVEGLASPSPTTPRLKPSRESELLALLADVPRLCKKPSSVKIGFGPLSTLSWEQRPNGKTFHVSLSLSPTHSPFTDPLDCVRVPTHVARRLLERGVRLTGAVERSGDGIYSVPLVPIAKTDCPLVITTIDEVYDAYQVPDELWSAGWNVETFGDKKLLTRCQDAITKPDVLEEIQDFQWQMARAAKAGRTLYGPPDVSDEEREVYEYGDAEPRCQPVGTHSATGMAEYTCALEPGEHIYGFEIYGLRSMVERKQTHDGQPITGVRVVFLEDWQAHSEKRPLLDNGIEVWVQDIERGDRQILE